MQRENTREPGLEKAYSLFISSGEDYGRSLTPPPEPKICEFCGKKLYYRGIRHESGLVTNWLFAEPCDCGAATAHREEQKRQEEEARRKREEEEANRRRIARIERLTGNSGMGERFKRRTFDTYECKTDTQRKCFARAKEYADNFDAHLSDGSGLFIAGSVGTGKTHLAAAISLQLLNQGVPVIFRTAMDMLGDIKRAYSGEVSESAVLNEYKQAKLLVIDDLGKERMTEWAAAVLYGIINARYENMLPTIVTTNFSTGDLLKSLGEETTRAQAILSRLMETCAFMPMKWGDYRTGGNGNG